MWRTVSVWTPHETRRRPRCRASVSPTQALVDEALRPTRQSDTGTVTTSRFISIAPRPRGYRGRGYRLFSLPGIIADLSFGSYKPMQSMSLLARSRRRSWNEDKSMEADANSGVIFYVSAEDHWTEDHG